MPPERLDATGRAQLLDIASRGIEQGDLDGARDVLHGLVVLDRQDAAAWTMLGRVERKLERPEEARAAFDVAMSLTPRDFDLALELADVQAQLGLAEQCEALISWVALESDGLTRDQLERIRRIDVRATGVRS